MSEPTSRIARRSTTYGLGHAKFDGRIDLWRDVFIVRQLMAEGVAQIGSERALHP